MRSRRLVENCTRNNALAAVGDSLPSKLSTRRQIAAATVVGMDLTVMGVNISWDIDSFQVPNPRAAQQSIQNRNRQKGALIDKRIDALEPRFTDLQNGINTLARAIADIAKIVDK